MERVELQIGGMTCGGCRASVERVLRATPGVAEVAVSLEAARASVQFDAAQTDVTQLLGAIQRAGFEAVQLPNS